MDLAKNFAKGTLAVGILDTDTSLDLSANNGARFPSPPFNATIWNSTDFPDPSDDPDVEVIRVTAITDDTFDTIERGQEGTAAVDHHIDGKTYQVIAGITAKVINEDLEHGILGRPGTGEITLAANGAGWYINEETNLTRIGDTGDSFNGTFVEVDDDNSRVNITKQPVFPDLPSSDPAIAGALYYDPVTGIVKRSAG